jgi:hypothetical protein
MSLTMRWFGTALLAAMLLRACYPTPAPAAELPPQAREHLPMLVTLQRQLWPDAPSPSFLAGQVEQESCISLKHPRCWNPHVELKTSREYGFGLGQTTIAYNADGSLRFDRQAELRAQYASLRGWTFERRFDPRYQLTALVEMDHGIYRRISDASSERERLAMTLSAYNGGESGLRQDRLLCRNTTGCDPDRWFGNVELHSVKSRTPFKGYGKSPFAINREYPPNVLDLRRPKYEPFFRPTTHADPQ